jgi:hypothetical protein
MMTMWKVRLVAMLAGALLLAGWLAKDTVLVRGWLARAPAVVPGALEATGGQVLATPPEGVHKCVVKGGGFVYSDQPCASPAAEKAVSGGVVTVTPMPKPKADPASAAIIKGFDPKAIDAMRDAQIDAAMHR